MRSALVCGAGGFIGGHLVKRLKAEGMWVRGVDLKRHEYAETEADDFVVGDLRDPDFCRHVVDRRFDEVYQLAADMGGAGFIFTGENDADIMHNSGDDQPQVLEACRKRRVRRIFYSSSACIYPAYNQQDPDNPQLRGKLRLPGGARQRIWLGEAVQRTAVSELCALPRHASSGSRAITTSSGRREPGPAGARKRRPPCAARSPVAEDGGCDRNLGRRAADAFVPLRLRMRRGYLAADAFGLRRAGQYRL